MTNQKIIQLGFQAQKHRHISTRSDCIGDVGCTDDPDIDLSGKHRLGGTTGNNKNKLRIETILSKKSLFLCEPQRNRVAAHGAVHEWKPDLGFSGVRLGAQNEEAK